MTVDIPRFMTIREVAKTGLLTEYTLRLMEKQKRLPCIYVGKRCLVNFEQLVDRLNQASQEGGSEAKSRTEKECNHE